MNTKSDTMDPEKFTERARAFLQNAQGLGGQGVRADRDGLACHDLLDGGLSDLVVGRDVEAGLLGQRFLGEGRQRAGGQLAGGAPILNGTSSTGLTTTLPNPAAAITAGTASIYAAVS